MTTKLVNALVRAPRCRCKQAGSLDGSHGFRLARTAWRRPPVRRLLSPAQAGLPPVCHRRLERPAGAGGVTGSRRTATRIR
jgi:hypothetical protein